MKCVYCNYYYQTENDEYPRCQWIGNGGDSNDPAPCEWETEDEDLDDYGY